MNIRFDLIGGKFSASRYFNFNIYNGQSDKNNAAKISGEFYFGWCVVFGLRNRAESLRATMQGNLS
ncbi:hypothetical protein T07_12768 [Trichinella nelsoni]|uniref:Uncharacterized protein n=1 Tax=Trichinella nelsoni TaxID=6336 RepID=A0A0V0S4T5_9BILA|nr:hypothetical protein T07_12768 [Trichinella nelsoni]